MKSKIKKNTMPESKQGFIQTLNKMGFMTTGLDSFSQEFVRFAPNAPGPVLDIGAAYGVASLEALAAGAELIANDLDTKHLEILKSRVPEEQRGKLSIRPGRFPEELDFAENSLGGVLCCRVLHFFNSAQVLEAVRKIYSWLKNQGKVYIVVETPYVNSLKNLIPIYEKRVEKSELWPGYFDNIHVINPELKEVLPPTMHLFDMDVLTRVFKNSGFIIERVETMARADFPQWLQLDGRESVGLIAKKEN